MVTSARNSRRRVLIATVLVGVVLSGCNGDDEPKGKSTTTTVATTTTAKPTLSKDFTIPTLLGFDAQFAPLNELVGLSSVKDTLGSDGPFTLFAPNAEAFAKLTAAEMAALKADPDGELATLLSLHVVKGKLSYADLVTGGNTTLESVDGQKLAVVVDGQNVSVGGAAVIKSDIEAENGVIHVLDNVAQPS